MNPSAGNSVAHTPALAQRVRERCVALGLPAWLLDADDVVREGPEFEGPAGDWLRAPALGAIISRRVADLEFGHRTVHKHATLFPGAELVVVPIREHRQLVTRVAVLVLSDEIFDAEQFDTIVSSARADRAVCESALRTTVCIPSARAKRTLSALLWMCEDLADNTKLKSDIETFGRQLSDSYEEIALLYKLREGISAETNPANFVDEASRDLLAVIPYQWVGLCFSRERREARSLAGEVMLYGEPPCAKDGFRYAVDLLAHSLAPGCPRILSGADRGGLASGTSQVAVIPFGKHDSIVGVIVAGGKNNRDDIVTSIEIKMLEAVAGHMLVLIENAGLYAEQRDTFLGTLQALTTAIDAKDRYTCGHSERVAFMSEQIALAAGMSPKDTERIRISGLVHDVGKIGVPESVLRKPGRLTEEEFDAIKLHPEIGHAILRDIPQLEDVLPGVLYHHERWDGRGYPYGLKGEEIPIMARVIGLADAFDAMSSNRTYRAAMPRSKVLSEIENGAGTQFDAELARRFLAIDLAAYDQLVERHAVQANAGQEKAA